MTDSNIPFIGYDKLSDRIACWLGGDERVLVLRVDPSSDLVYDVIKQIITQFAPDLVLSPTGMGAKTIEDASGHAASTVHRSLYKASSGKGDAVRWIKDTGSPANSSNLTMLAGVVGLHPEAFKDLLFASRKLLVISNLTPGSSSHAMFRDLLYNPAVEIFQGEPQSILDPKTGGLRIFVPNRTSDMQAGGFVPAGILPGYFASKIDNKWYCVFGRGKSFDGPIAIVKYGNDHTSGILHGEVFLSSERDIPPELRNREIILVSPLMDYAFIPQHDARKYAFVEIERQPKD